MTEQQQKQLIESRAPALLMGYLTTPNGAWGNAFLIRTEQGEDMLFKVATLHQELEDYTDGPWERTIVYFDKWVDDEKHNNVIENATAVIANRNHTTGFEFIRI
ncbi:hypothetical protein [Aeromonas hydrophila]|uniref:hypothetical protein n=1 Tax=Aeromonas hydrophila TaxID=644 RepID=UPI000332A910|nr:hypothetical protein [Aeromonas hydrophila]AGM44166.1 hypothetical protein AHML_11930 [Aeromonas hydrophila ML09-119]AHX32839.1 hypothetical protein V428_12315 [Aeromonas hydrophila subsp. hydrophila AL09-71]AHX69637.1 hypothetical protein V429_12330 [Aeromonas hydrophila pc104A]AJE38622.1 hypothetical protein V469_10745 [Aeromonas hydrophila J-1]AKJ37050.1 hypothetical protein U876_11155 [Aeromonas hydrophila NJ-35]